MSQIEVTSLVKPLRDGPVDEPAGCRALPVTEQAAVLAFLEKLPLALERADLRVVDAAWQEPSISILRNVAGPLELAYRRIEDAIDASEESCRLRAAAMPARRALETLMHDPDAQWTEAHRPLIEASGALDEFMQSSNPIRVITSGLESRVTFPFFAAGKWREVCVRIKVVTPELKSLPRK